MNNQFMYSDLSTCPRYAPEKNKKCFNCIFKNKHNEKEP